MTAEITQPDTAALEAEALAWPERAATVAISTQADYQEAAQLLIGLKALEAEIRDTFDEPISDAHKLHRSLLDRRKRHLGPVEEAARIIRGKMGRFVQGEKQARVIAAQEARRSLEIAPPPAPLPEADGVVERQTWNWTVEDADAIPREYLQVDTKKIGAVVRALGLDAKIPGIRVEPVTQIAVRR